MKPHNEQERFRDLIASMIVGDHILCPGELLRRAAVMYTDTPALIWDNNELTYRALYERSCAFAHTLARNGVQPRDRVIISLHNSPAFYIAYCAAWHLGAVVTPVNTFLTQSELKHIISDAEPALCVVDKTRVEVFRSAGATRAIITEEEVVTHTNKQAPPPELIILKPDECATLLYTSGTTGVPKGVMLSCRNIMINIAQVMARLHIEHDSSDRVFAVLPLFHVLAQNTCFWTSFFAGVSVIIVSKIERRTILEALKHKPTVFIGVPALYGLLCAMKQAPLESIRLFVSGGDMLPDKIRTIFALLYHRKIANGYGLTETSPVLAAMLEDELVPTGTVGKPLMEISYEIRDLDGKPQPPGVSGLLWIRGDNVMIGYYRDTEATRSVFKNGWFNTGDLAYVDKKDRLVFTGREKDLIVTKGFNVYPSEIENVIMQHPNVIGIGVIGCPEPAIGEYIVAYVQLRTDQKGIEQELKQLCSHAIAAYKIPRKFICSTDELPITATRKIDKKILRQQCAAKHSNDVADK
jgi:acyl-CoA synthetase (AMP-forming)/AMP-acid ligase II